VAKFFELQAKGYQKATAEEETYWSELFTGPRCAFRARADFALGFFGAQNFDDLDSSLMTYSNSLTGGGSRLERLQKGQHSRFIGVRQ